MLCKLTIPQNSSRSDLENSIIDCQEISIYLQKLYLKEIHTDKI